MWGIHRSSVNFPHKGQWRRTLMFSLICALNKPLSKQSWCWWFETTSRSLWRYCNANQWYSFFYGENQIIYFWLRWYFALIWWQIHSRILMHPSKVCLHRCLVIQIMLANTFRSKKGISHSLCRWFCCALCCCGCYVVCSSYHHIYLSMYPAWLFPLDFHATEVTLMSEGEIDGLLLTTKALYPK